MYEIVGKVLALTVSDTLLVISLWDSEKKYIVEYYSYRVNIPT